MPSHRNRPGSSASTADLPPLGETLRQRRLQRGLELADAAAALGIPAKSLRVLEWDRHDLLESPREAERIERQYAAFLDLEVSPPPPEREAAAAPPSPREVNLAEWLPLLAALGPPIVIALALVLDDVPIHVLGLVFLASLLLVAAALPSSVVARTPVASASFESYRQPFGLAAIGILVPVAVFTVLTTLT